MSRAVELEKDNGGWWFDLGLLHKWRGRFAEGFECNLKAKARLGEQKSVLWNLAICATAIGEGDIAAGIWNELGMESAVNSKSGMPFVDNIPPLLVRVLSRHHDTTMPSPIDAQAARFEVLWVAPLSPCHGVVQSPSFGDAPIDYGDVVLWDGAPASRHAMGATLMPIFPILEVLRRGKEHRWPFVAAANEQQLHALEQALPQGGRVFIQDQQADVSCSHCAQGMHLQDHEHNGPSNNSLLYGKLVFPEAAALSDIEASVDICRKFPTGPRLAIPQLYELLGDTRRAGQEHQAWLGIERRHKKIHTS